MDDGRDIAAEALPIALAQARADVIAAAREVVSPCQFDHRWCVAHNERTPCLVGLLHLALDDLDALLRLAVALEVEP